MENKPFSLLLCPNDRNASFFLLFLLGCFSSPTFSMDFATSMGKDFLQSLAILRRSFRLDFIVFLFSGLSKLEGLSKKTPIKKAIPHAQLFLIMCRKPKKSLGTFVQISLISLRSKRINSTVLFPQTLQYLIHHFRRRKLRIIHNQLAQLFHPLIILFLLRYPAL